MTAPRSDGRAFARDLLLLIALPLVLTTGLAVWLIPWRRAWSEFSVVPYAPPTGDVFAAVAGTWDWVGGGDLCVEDSHEIRFSPDRAVMTIEHARPVGDSAGVRQREWEYDVVEFDRTRIRGAIRGEERLTPAGEPVVWDLVLTGPDSYRWHRADWAASGYTGEVRRCVGAAPPTEG
jgi:hypothetical protein